MADRRRSTTTLWTGPVHAPGRYVVDAPGGTPHHEPGGGVEGRVYRATVHDPGAEDDRDTVALKILLACSPDEIELVTERLAPLFGRHDPRLMRVRSTFVGTALTDDPEPDDDEFDVCCVVADWVDGTPLNEAAADQDVAWRLRVTAELARAIDALHGVSDASAPEGILHRDLKTSNVRVTPDGGPVLVDYGLARPAGVDASVVGTPGWLAPEVAGGRPGGKPADVYGLGAIAFDLLTGAPPRRDGILAARSALRQHLSGQPCAHEIAAHIADLLASEPEDRPDDLVGWADALDRLRAGERPKRTVGGSTRAVVMAAAASVAALVLAGTWWATRHDAGGSDEVASSSTTATTAAAPTTAGEDASWDCDRHPVLPEGAVGEALGAAFDALDGVCAGSVDSLAGGVTLRTLDAEGEPEGALVASPTTPAVRLTASQMASWLEVLGRGEPEKSATFAGFPTEVSHDRASGYDVIELSAGGLMAGPADDSQVFWIPVQVRSLWEERGGLTGELGAPTSPVFLTGVNLRLEFERGVMEVQFKTGLGGAATWLDITSEDIEVRIVDPAAELAALGPIADRVLRQANGTSWYVDTDGVLHWIPDSPTWGCLQANQKVLPVDVPGYAIAAVPRGERARC